MLKQNPRIQTHIQVNGMPETIPYNSVLSAYLNASAFSEKMFAVAINGGFVARGRYEETILKDGDAVDIVMPMQGG